MSMVLYGLLALFLAIVMGFIPVKVLRRVTSVFSLKEQGIRTMKRRHDRTDTLANLCLFVSIVFSLFHWLIPGSYMIYGVLLAVSYLCVLGQTSRITVKMDQSQHSTIVICISLMFFFGLFSAIGCFNDFVTFDSAIQFRHDLFSGRLFDILYFLHSFAPMMVLLQAILYLLPMYCMWAQFKYMRLENTYKSRNIGLFVLKVLFLCMVMVALSYGGIEVLNWAYYIDHVEV